MSLRNLNLPPDYLEYINTYISTGRILTEIESGYLYQNIRNMMLSEGFVDGNYLPVAYVKSGPVVLMSLEKENYGYCYIWLNDYADFKDSMMDSSSLIAKNFTELRKNINLLQQ